VHRAVCLRGQRRTRSGTGRSARDITRRRRARRPATPAVLRRVARFATVRPRGAAGRAVRSLLSVPAFGFRI